MGKRGGTHSNQKSIHTHAVTPSTHGGGKNCTQSEEYQGSMLTDTASTDGGGGGELHPIRRVPVHIQESNYIRVLPPSGVPLWLLKNVGVVNPTLVSSCLGVPA